MECRFNEQKATQVAALLLKLRGNRMKYIKLIKLMYLVDREALRRWGRPVTTDHFVSMDKGPVLSRVYSLISEEQEEPTFWTTHIEPTSGHDVQLIADPGDGELSLQEEQLIKSVFDQHGHKCRWKIIDELHKVPEWQDPKGSMIPIAVDEILKALGKTPAEIEAISRDLDVEAFADLVWSR